MRTTALFLLLFGTNAHAQHNATVTSVGATIALDRGSRDGIHPGDTLIAGNAPIDIVEVDGATSKGRSQQPVKVSSQAAFLPWQCAPFPAAPIPGSTVEGRILSDVASALSLANGSRA